MVDPIKKPDNNAEQILEEMRAAVVEKLKREGGMDNLWTAIEAFEGDVFYTSKGLEFQYSVKGGEIKVDRKEKSITRSSVEIAYRKVCEWEKSGNGAQRITGPKKLGVFGSSYLYPVFVRLGMIE